MKCENSRDTEMFIGVCKYIMDNIIYIVNYLESSKVLCHTHWSECLKLKNIQNEYFTVHITVNCSKQCIVCIIFNTF